MPGGPAEVVFRENQDKVLIKIDISDPGLYREQFEHIARTYGQKVSRELYAHAADDQERDTAFDVFRLPRESDG